MSNNNLVLFYSNKCIHSKEFLTLLHKDSSLNNQTTKVNVDNPNIKLPPYIKSVPSLIINENNKPNLLVGRKIFDWYNQQHKQNISKDSIMDWDPCTMSGYSDGFSYLESDDVMKKSYSFIDSNDKINTPDESSFDSGKSSSGPEKTQLDNDYENFMASRSNEVAAPIQRMS
tara:strand:- start:2428 stop:2943 length:516 start_codon:yes stop_codon:yes gene_type:complete